MFSYLPLALFSVCVHVGHCHSHFSLDSWKSWVTSMRVNTSRIRIFFLLLNNFKSKERIKNSKMSTTPNSVCSNSAAEPCTEQSVSPVFNRSYICICVHFHAVLQTRDVREQGVGPAASAWRVGSLGAVQCLLQVLWWRNPEHQQRLQQA